MLRPSFGLAIVLTVDVPPFLSSCSRDCELLTESGLFTELHDRVDQEGCCGAPYTLVGINVDYVRSFDSFVSSSVSNIQLFNGPR